MDAQLAIAGKFATLMPGSGFLVSVSMPPLSPISRRRWLKAAILAAAGLSCPARANAWNVVKINGQDYVQGKDIRDFYRFQQYQMAGKTVSFQSPRIWMRGTVDSKELLIRGVKFILSFPVAHQGNDALFSRLDLVKLIDPVLRPDYIRGTPDFGTVVIDAGHGGHDSGARGPSGMEKTFALQTALRLQTVLRGLGFRTVMTRSDDRFIALGDRVNLANRHPRSIFVSVHFNHATNATARGIETFALAPAGASSTIQRWPENNLGQRKGNLRDAENIALATAVHSAVLRRVLATKPVDRGIKRARFAVISGITMPGILFEGGFMANPQESRLIASPSYQQMLAEGIAAGVQNYRRALRR